SAGYDIRPRKSLLDVKAAAVVLAAGAPPHRGDLIQGNGHLLGGRALKISLRDDLGPVDEQRCFAAAQSVGDESNDSKHRNETAPANHNQFGNDVSPSGISLEHKLQGVAQIPRLQLPSSDVPEANH